MSSHRKVCVQLGRPGAGCFTQWVLAKADGLRERTGAGVCGVLKLCSRTFGKDQARIPYADAEFSASAGVVKLSAEQFLSWVIGHGLEGTGLLAATLSLQIRSIRS